MLQETSLVCQQIFSDYIKNMSKKTILTLESVLNEFLNYTEKGFLDINSTDVNKYYLMLQKKVQRSQQQGSTMSKKIHILHAFAAFIVENHERYDVLFENYFAPYLKLVEKVRLQAKLAPIEHIDKLFQAAEDDLQGYCILLMAYRMGLKTSEIAEIEEDDLAIYENGMYIYIKQRYDYCYVPEDVMKTVNKYLQQKAPNKYLFFNNRGNPINPCYVTRMIKKYVEKSGIPNYSLMTIRNSCAFVMDAYGASDEQKAQQLGIGMISVRRYKDTSYRNDMKRKANELVRIRVDVP